MRDHSITANTVFSEETENYSTTDYNALACCAFAQARSRNWSAAYEDAQKVTLLGLYSKLSLTNACEKSVNIQPSTIGHIAKAIALVGQRDYKAAMRAFALVFRDGDPNENEFMLVIWVCTSFVCILIVVELVTQAVLSCLAGEYIDGILRVHDLVNTTEADKATRNCVQAGSWYDTT